MATVVTGTLQTIWDCRWSRPGLRLIGVTPSEQPEPVWVCVRTGERREANEGMCAECPHWELDEQRRT